MWSPDVYDDRAIKDRLHNLTKMSPGCYSKVAVWRAFCLFVCVGAAGSLLTPSLSWCYLKTSNKNVKFEIINPFCFVRINMSKDFHENAQYWNEIYRTGKNTVCSRVCALFSQDMLQAEAVRGLTALQKSRLPLLRIQVWDSCLPRLAWEKVLNDFVTCRQNFDFRMFPRPGHLFD